MRPQIAILLAGLLSASNATLAIASSDRFLHRDSLYEQTLRAAASADKEITPAKVLRWMRSSLFGQVVSTRPSNVEFRPIVKVHENDRRVLATIAYTF